MSNTYLHKAKGKFNNGIDVKYSPLTRYFERWNSERSYFAPIRNAIIERQIDEEITDFNRICDSVCTYKRDYCMLIEHCTK